MKKEKWIALALAACMLLGLTACSEEDTEEIAENPTEKTYQAARGDETTGGSWAGMSTPGTPWKWWRPCPMPIWARRKLWRIFSAAAGIF